MYPSFSRLSTGIQHVRGPSSTNPGVILSSFDAPDHILRAAEIIVASISEVGRHGE